MKVLLLPVVVGAFAVFLLFLGAVGLGVAMTLITTVGKLFSLLARGGRLLSSGGRRLRWRRLRRRGPESASAD